MIKIATIILIVFIILLFLWNFEVMKENHILRAINNYYKDYLRDLWRKMDEQSKEEQ